MLSKKEMKKVMKNVGNNYIDENTFVAYYYGDEGGKLSKFTKVAPEDVIDKTEVILGCYYLEPDVKSKIIEFNKANTEYRINIKDYSTYDTIEDYTQGMTRLNADIVAGDVPDIMILNTQMPVESYAAKGIFADLNEFLEKDTEVKKDDLLPNILEALSLNGELYRIAPFFSVNTFAAKTADVGEEPGWTMDEALALLATKPEGTNLLSEMTASSFMYYTMWICGEQYVDWENGECHFDSDGFMKILEYANTLPRTIEYTAIMDDESYWKELDEQYRNGKTILNPQYLSGFRDYAYVEQAVFGEDITLIGFPTEEGNGAGLNIGTTMAISAISKHKDVAWEFVKLFLKEDYQDELTYNFPVRISSLRKLEEKAWEKPYYLDENGNKVEDTTKNFYDVNDVVAITGYSQSKSYDIIKQMNKELKDISLKAIFYSSLTNPCTRFVNSLVYAVVALAGSITVLNNPLFTIGSLSALLSYANQYTKPFNEISSVIAELQNALASFSRVYEFLNEDEEIKIEGDAVNVQSYFSVTVDGNVQGSISAGNCVTCDTVYSSVNAGNCVTCDSVYGSVSAGNCITCDDICGSVSVGNDLTCENINGDVNVTGNIECDTIEAEYITCEGDIKCKNKTSDNSKIII